MRVIKKIPWLLLTILAIAAFLRLYGLGSESIWLDEAFRVSVSKISPLSIIKLTATGDVHPPLYYLLLHFWMLAFGQSEVALRSLSACLGIISVLLMYEVGRKLFNHRIGLLSSFLLAISTFAVWYSQDANPYSLLLSVTLLSFFFFIKVLKADKPSITLSLCYLSANILLCYTHIYGLFTIASQVLFFLVFRRKYSKARLGFWSVQAVTLLAFSPWLLFLVTTIIDGTFTSLAVWLPKPTPELVFDFFKFLVGGGSLDLLLILVFLLLCITGVSELNNARQRNSKKTSPQSNEYIRFGKLIRQPSTALLLIWFFFPLVASLIISLTIESIFWARYLIGIAPALYILAARGIENIEYVARTFKVRANASIILVSIVALLITPALYNLYAYPQNEQSREAANLIDQRFRTTDVVAVYPDGYRDPFEYYYKGDKETIVDSSKVLQDSQLTAGKERLWLAFYNFTSTVNAPIKNELLARYGNNSLIEQKEFFVVTVYLFDISH